MRPVDPELAPKALNDLGHLASGVGHHVINAFSAIVSNAELLRIKLAPNAPPNDPAAIADLIIGTAVEASTVARRLIDHTRPVTAIGQCQLAFDELVAKYVEVHRLDESEEIAWSARIEPVPPILGNAGQLESMLDLLVENARESMKADSDRAIAFTISTDSRDWVMLEIRDTGNGMEPAILERAVEPFFSTKSGHAGVGLSIANGIWRRHRGTLSLKSQPGEGTVLRLCVEPCSR
jgi:two-component system, NtrC family, sensor kinase